MRNEVKHLGYEWEVCPACRDTSHPRAGSFATLRMTDRKAWKERGEHHGL